MSGIDKIQRVTGTGQASEIDNKKTVGSEVGKFNNFLNSAEEKNISQKLRNMVDRIIEQGEMLGKRVDIKDLKVYKNLVKEFLEEAISNSMKFSKESFLDRRGRHKIIAKVEKVNEELDELTKEVLSAEKDNLKILKKLEDIRGLVLDLMI